MRKNINNTDNISKGKIITLTLADVEKSNLALRQVAIIKANIIKTTLVIG